MLRLQHMPACVKADKWLSAWVVECPLHAYRPHSIACVSVSSRWGGMDATSGHATQHCLDVVIMRCYYSSGSMCGRDMRRANLLVQRPGALCAEAPLLAAIAQVTHCSQSLSRRGALQVPH